MANKPMLSLKNVRLEYAYLTKPKTHFQGKPIGTNDKGTYSANAYASLKDCQEVVTQLEEWAKEFAEEEGIKKFDDMPYERVLAEDGSETDEYRFRFIQQFVLPGKDGEPDTPVYITVVDKDNYEIPRNTNIGNGTTGEMRFVTRLYPLKGKVHMTLRPCGFQVDKFVPYEGGFNPGFEVKKREADTPEATEEDIPF